MDPHTINKTKNSIFIVSVSFEINCSVWIFSPKDNSAGNSGHAWPACAFSSEKKLFNSNNTILLHSRMATEPAVDGTSKPSLESLGAQLISQGAEAVRYVSINYVLFSHSLRGYTSSHSFKNLPL